MIVSFGSRQELENERRETTQVHRVRGRFDRCIRGAALQRSEQKPPFPRVQRDPAAESRVNRNGIKQRSLPLISGKRASGTPRGGYAMRGSREKHAAIR